MNDMTTKPVNEWLSADNREGSVPCSEIPQLSYAEWFADMRALLRNESCRCASCFGVREGDGLRIYSLMADDAAGRVYIASARVDAVLDTVLPSLTALYPAMHAFERDLAERFGVRYGDHPWLKPLRFPADRADRQSTASNYPFYGVRGESLHEVNVGPIHAGIIEPGVFRFICNGEEIRHLEIVLGFQHRDVERLVCSTPNRLRQTVLAETMAGDSVVAHATAYARLVEKLAPDALRGQVASTSLPVERAVALEMERIAVHLADTGAICTDIGYQLGQVACEALRTVVINSMQLWCGNRFSKGLIRPFGSHYPLTEALREMILKNLADVDRRYGEVAYCILNEPSVLGRLEDCGVVPSARASRIGAVGLAARASGLSRDVRSSHGWDVYGRTIVHEPVVEQTGDVMARLKVRIGEVAQSVGYVKTLLGTSMPDAPQKTQPRYDVPSAPDRLAFSLVEGWRGEVCHAALTDAEGRLAVYRAVDPSLHNWLALALAVRRIGISDFPINNKSFSLSYCGHDM